MVVEPPQPLVPQQQPPAAQMQATCPEVAGPQVVAVEVPAKRSLSGWYEESDHAEETDSDDSGADSSGDEGGAPPMWAPRRGPALTLRLEECGAPQQPLAFTPRTAGEANEQVPRTGKKVPQNERKSLGDWWQAEAPLASGRAPERSPETPRPMLTPRGGAIVTPRSGRRQEVVSLATPRPGVAVLTPRGGALVTPRSGRRQEVVSLATPRAAPAAATPRGGFAAPFWAGQQHALPEVLEGPEISPEVCPELTPQQPPAEPSAEGPKQAPEVGKLLEKCPLPEPSTSQLRRCPSPARSRAPRAPEEIEGPVAKEVEGPVATGEREPATCWACTGRGKGMGAWSWPSWLFKRVDGKAWRQQRGLPN